jgi:hypothetical protein
MMDDVEMAKTRKFVRTAVRACAFALLIFVGLAFAQTVGLKTKLPPPFPGKSLCPDPAVRDITFALVSRTGKYKGRVRITGLIKNLGGFYHSRPNQQKVQLTEDDRVIAESDFPDLGQEEERTLGFEREWNVYLPPGAVLVSPVYKLRILYDPDITGDGNPRNDDCNGVNNFLQRDGSDIRNFFK